MSDMIDRRRFMRGGLSAAAMLSAGLLASRTANVPAAEGGRQIKKTLKFSMIQRDLTIAERLQIAVDAGFEATEPDTIFDAAQVVELKREADKVGLHLDAIICSRHWSHPLSDPDPKVADVCMDSMRVSMQNAKDLGGDMVLLVPGVVKPDVTYRQAYDRTLPRVKELAQEAEKMGITIGLENVWNKFLLSPLETRRYIEEIGSSHVKMWFDVGNIVLYGYPQDWIRTLGDLIVRVDVKDFDSKTKQFVPLREGSVDWPEVMRAFDEIGYEGYFAAEVRGGDLKHLTEVVSEPMDLIIAGK